MRTISASRDNENCTLRNCFKIEKQAVAVVASCVVKVTSELMCKTRSCTVDTRCTDAISSCIDVVVIWCRRRAEAH